MAFHPYPQLIPYLFNGSGFGPPAGVTQPSSWPWVDHLVSGLHPATESPCSDSLSRRLPYAVKLATECKSLTHYTKGTQSPLLQTPSRCFRRAARRFSLTLESPATPHLETDMTSVSLLLNTFESHRYAMRLERTSKEFRSSLILLSRIATRCASKELRRRLKQGLPLFVCMRFQDLFHSPPGVLFAFPSRYWFTIGRSRVFSLGGWSPHLQTGFHVSRPTCRTLSSTTRLSHTGLSPTMAGLSRPLC